MSSEVYVLGQNSRNQVGNEFETSSTITKWTPVEKYSRYGKIKQIAFGPSFSIALLHNNILIVAGDNSHWTIGGHFGKNFKYITQLLPWTFFSKNKLPNMAYSQKRAKGGHTFANFAFLRKLDNASLRPPLFFFRMHAIYTKSMHLRQPIRFLPFVKMVIYTHGEITHKTVWDYIKDSKIQRISQIRVILRID